MKKIDYILKYSIVLILILTLSQLETKAQNFELGAGLGLASYQGELSDGTFKHFFSHTEPIAHISIGFQPFPFYITQLEIYGGELSGDDATSEKSDRNERNLNFNSFIYGFNLRQEFNILPMDYYEDRLFTPYVFVSAGMMHFNPTTYYNSEKIYLRDLGTEGQGLSGYPDLYNLWTFNINGGGGVKIRITPEIYLGVELAYNKTFTDYLDDVSAAENIDYAVILENRGPIVADLSNKRDDYLNIDPALYNGNMQRGTPGSDDGYYFAKVRFIYLFADFFSNSKKVRCSQPF